MLFPPRLGKLRLVIPRRLQIHEYSSSPPNAPSKGSTAFRQRTSTEPVKALLQATFFAPFSLLQHPNHRPPFLPPHTLLSSPLSSPCPARSLIPARPTQLLGEAAVKRRLPGSSPSDGRAQRGAEFFAYGERGRGACGKASQQRRQGLAASDRKVDRHLLLLLLRDLCWGLGELGRRALSRILTSVLSAAFSAIFLLRSRQREECFIPIRASQGVGASGLIFCFAFSKISKH